MQGVTFNEDDTLDAPRIIAKHKQHSSFEEMLIKHKIAKNKEEANIILIASAIFMFVIAGIVVAGELFPHQNLNEQQANYEQMIHDNH
jgi:hypothetical protein